MIPLGRPFLVALVLAAIAWHPLVAAVMVGVLAISAVFSFLLGAAIAEGSEPARTVLGRVYAGRARH